MDKVGSVLNFKGYKVENIKFNINNNFTDNSNEDMKVDIDFNVQSEINRDNSSLTINLATRLFNEYKIKNNPFNLEVSIYGYFEYNKDISEDILQGLVKNNAVAILYPYLRSLVSVITCNSGFAPIILPTINVNKLMQKDNSKEKAIT